MTTATLAEPRTVRAPRGSEISCRGWQPGGRRPVLELNVAELLAHLD